MPGLLVALDLPTPEDAVALARKLAPHVDGFKVGLQLLLGADPGAVERVAEIGLPVFVDAKLHDIPATVERAARQLGKRGARWVTVHLSGGSEMVRAARNGLESGSAGREAGILGVTVLTSLGPTDLSSIGIDRSLDEQVRGLAMLAADGGCEGVVCSVHEVPIIRASRPSLITVTPGIREAADSSDDQRRVASVDEAIAAGSDFLVVGRAIRSAPDPVAAAAAFSRSLRSARN